MSTPNTERVLRRCIHLLLSVTPAVLAFALVAMALFAPDELPPQASISTEHHVLHPLTKPLSIPEFRDITLDAGLFHVHEQGDDRLTGLNEALGAGVCVLDFNQDGWMDLFFVGGSGHTRYYGKQHWWQTVPTHRLYQNAGHGKFRDVTGNAGLAITSWGMGCAVGDFDNDGHEDLFVTNIAGNALYRNQGDGTFSDKSASLPQSTRWSTSAAVGDYDKDGRLDIYIVNYLRYEKSARTFENHGGFALTDARGFEPALYDGSANQLLHNDGDWHFTDQAAHMGVDDASGRGLSAVWFDLHQDGDLDLFVSNDAGSPDKLFVQESAGPFRDATTTSGLAHAGASSGIAVGDIDNDGDVDLIVGGIRGELPRLLINGSSPFVTTVRDDTPFLDIARRVSLAQDQNAALHTWSPLLVDLNNDGRLDVAAADGVAMIDPLVKRISQGQPMQIWLNAGDVRHPMQTIPSATSPLQDRLTGRGLVAVDIDNDGDRDLVVTQNNGLAQLLENQSPSTNGWIGFRFIDEYGRPALGAAAHIRQGVNNTIRHSLPNSFLSQSDSRIHTGLDSATEAVAVDIIWPNGTQTTHTGLTPNQYYDIDFRSRAVQPRHDPSAPPPKTLRLAGAVDTPLRRAEWLALLPHTGDTATLVHFAEQGLRDKNTWVRRAAVEALFDVPHYSALTLLIRALYDTNMNVRTAAVEGLRRLEHEHSVRWLLNALEDSASEVRLAAAAAFIFLFREEEAMAHRKFLAVPALIRLLQDPDESVRYTAVLALAESEHYRAVAPLMAMLNDKQATLRAAAATALGRTRNQDATDALLIRALLPYENATVRAQSILALQRLADERVILALETLLADFKDEEATAFAAGGLLVLVELLNPTSDTGVLDASRLSTLALDWYQRRTPNEAATQLAAMPGTAVSAFATLLVHADPSSQVSDAWDRLPIVPDAVIQASIVSARIRHAPLPDRPPLLVKAFSESSLEFRQALFAHLAKHAVPIPATLLESQLAHPELTVAVVQSLRRNTDVASRRALLTLATRQDLPPAALPLIADSLRDALPDHWATSSDLSTQIAAMDALGVARTLKSARTILKTLENDTAPPALRRAAINAVAQSSLPALRNTLMTLAQQRRSPWRIDALRRLPTSDAACRAYLESVARNPKEATLTRLTAAKQLGQSAPATILATLRELQQ